MFDQMKFKTILKTKALNNSKSYLQYVVNICWQDQEEDVVTINVNSSALTKPCSPFLEDLSNLITSMLASIATCWSHKVNTTTNEYNKKVNIKKMISTLSLKLSRY